MDDTVRRASGGAGREQPSRGELRRQRERERRARTVRRRWVTIVIIVLLVAALGVLGWLFVLPDDSRPGGEPADYAGPGDGSVEVTVLQGDDAVTIGSKLEAADVVKSKEAFTAALDAAGTRDQIQPGTYTLKLKMPASEAVALLLDPANLVAKGFTITAGATVKDIVVNAVARTGIPQDEFNALLADPGQAGLPAEAAGSFEGWLAPGEYPVTSAETAVSLFTAIVSNRVEQLTAAGVPQEQWQSVLVTASIVEAEGTTDEYKSMIATTINNRIAKHMPINSDIVVAYGLGKNPSDLTSEDFGNSSNPYDVSILLGLPPTSINNPSLASISAVLNPTPGDWLYWVVVNYDTGETKFTASRDQYLKDRDEYFAYLEGK